MEWKRGRHAKMGKLEHCPRHEIGKKRATMGQVTPISGVGQFLCCAQFLPFLHCSPFSILNDVARFFLSPFFLLFPYFPCSLSVILRFLPVSSSLSAVIVL